MATCQWEGCTVEVPVSKYKNGSKHQPKYCADHVNAAKRQGALGRAPVLGERKTDGHGYVHISTEHGWVPEHRLLMEEKLGRSLQKGEEVWHKNGDSGDNRLENLELRVGFGTSLSNLVCPHCGVTLSDPVERSERSSEATV